jgi:hypothetical protein
VLGGFASSTPDVAFVPDGVHALELEWHPADLALGVGELDLGEALE